MRAIIESPAKRYLKMSTRVRFSFKIRFSRDFADYMSVSSSPVIMRETIRDHTILEYENCGESRCGSGVPPSPPFKYLMKMK